MTHELNNDPVSVAEAAELLLQFAQLLSPPLGVPDGGRQQQVFPQPAAPRRPLVARDYVERLDPKERAALARLIGAMLGEK